MLSETVRNIMGRFSHHPSVQTLEGLDFAEPDTDTEADSEVAVGKVEPAARVVWSPARLALVHQLWGSGFVFPGGEIETLRLARPLGASEATSLLIVGVGSGGPASSVASNMGTWVTGMERVNHYADVTGVFDRKKAALSEHKSQIKNPDELETLLRRWLGGNAEAAGWEPGRLAEAFWVMDTA